MHGRVCVERTRVKLLFKSNSNTDGEKNVENVMRPNTVRRQGVPKCLEIDFVIDFGLYSMSTEERRRRTVRFEKETPRDCTREWMWIDVIENDFSNLETDDRRDQRFETKTG